MSNTSNVSAARPAIGGAIHVGATTATMPTNATAALTGFKTLGYISESGITEGFAPTSEQIKAWGGDVVLNLVSERPNTFKFGLLEILNEDVLKIVFGDENVTTSDDKITVKKNAKQLENKAYVIDEILNGGKVKRTVIPRATVTALDDITYDDSAAIVYGITLTAMPDANGDYSIDYIE